MTPQIICTCRPRKRHSPRSRNSARGDRIATAQVTKYPLSQRDRCLIQGTNAALASSKVVVGTISVLYPARASRKPSSASSVTL